MMAKNLIKKEYIKDIFEKMDYDIDAIESWELALAWIKKHNNKFYSSPDIYTESANIYSEICESLDIAIQVNVINEDNIKKLIVECENGYKEWSNIKGIRKAKLFNKLPLEIEKNSALICQLEMKIRNIFQKDTRRLSIPALTEFFQYYAGLIVKRIPDQHYEPQGVCVISLSNTIPLALIGMVVAPCLAAGNAVILSVAKELIPICFLIKELCNNVGFPRDIIKIVKGDLQCILKHDAVKKLTYVGDLFDKKYTTLRMETNKSFNALHLGKSSMLIFDSADVDSVVDSLIDITMGYRAFYPWAVDTIYVQESIYESLQEKLNSKYKSIGRAETACYKNGDVLKDTITNISFGYKDAGTNVLYNNEDKTLKILSFRTAIEGVALANNTRLGLAASVWTENISLANEVAAKLKACTVWINTHGYLTPSCTIAPFKKSGKGYFSGREGFVEYLNYSSPMKDDADEQNDGNTLATQTIKQSYLFYGGAFKKSESGMFEDNVEQLHKKDVRNMVEIALKAQDGWKKISSTVRGQQLRKFSDNCSTIKISSNYEPLIHTLVEDLYEWSSMSCSLTTLNVGSPMLTGVKEPFGIVAIDVKEGTEQASLKLAIAALSSGNVVIIVDKLENHVLMKEICTKCPLPAGVFNVISTSNECVITHLKNHQELNAYFTAQAKCVENVVFQNNQYNLKHINIENNESIFNAVARTKNIWTSVGESFL